MTHNSCKHPIRVALLESIAGDVRESYDRIGRVLSATSHAARIGSRSTVRLSGAACSGVCCRISHGDVLQHRKPFGIVGLEMNVCTFKFVFGPSFTENLH